MRQFFHQIHLWLSIPLGILISVICLRCDPGVREGNNTDDVSRNPDNAGRRATWQETTPRIFPPGTCPASLDARRACPKGRAICWKDGGGYHDRGDDRHPDKWNDNLVSAKRFWYDSHVALGFYSTLLLLIMALTGLTWSFPGYRAFMYDLFAGLPIENLRRFFYSLHTGTWGGLPTQILYFLASLTGGILPLSGYYLWWKKRKRK